MSVIAPVELLAVGMVTPVGLTARSTATAVRAGISRVRESSLRGSYFEPLELGLLEDEHLPALTAAVAAETRGTPPHYRRMLRLAAPALQQACSPWKQALPIPLLLALPEPHPNGPDMLSKAFLTHLAAQSGVTVEGRLSSIFRQGRAGGLLALQQAMELIAQRRTDVVCVGAVDTFFDLERICRLQAEGRIASRGPGDKFTPGEGAAFLLLGTRSLAQHLRLQPTTRVMGVGLGREQGSLYSDRPHLGNGLADALRSLFASLPEGLPKVASVQAGLNGESYWAKEWGVAWLRNAHHFEEKHTIDHPAENFGDPGAALGPLLVGLAAQALERGRRPSPCLVWCASDGEERAAALVYSTRSSPAD